ncbi:hypothetical protein B0T10DRAFT_607976 [Thelonectria olida]|uniref:Acetylesterase n=1 Tax=Thelonectria olida TaxID=1576542 RepID=A0A9P8W0C4_9HYPO|nr:hypothetical protein B0T10DRAFT_607976 [Thelonectria olida]
MRSPFFAMACLLAGAVTVDGASKLPRNYLITFGDSYSKTGFQPHLDQPSPQNPLGNPELPGRTSAGGRNWIGWMVTEFNSSFAASNSSVTLSYNFAGSGSTVDKHLVRARKEDFEDQVNAFNKHYGGEERHWTAENAVVGVWFGVNDIRRSFSNIKAGDLITSVLVSYFEKLEMLYIIGLRKFVLLSVPPLSMIPDMQNLHDRGISELNSAVEIWNGLLREKLQAFKKAHKDVAGQIVDTSSTFWAGLRDPQAFGAHDTVCKSHDGLSCLWWDGGHPATKIERLVAAEVSKTLSMDEFRCYGNLCEEEHDELRM